MSFSQETSAYILLVVAAIMIMAMFLPIEIKIEENREEEDVGLEEMELEEAGN
jgi:hypothetical protein